MVFREILIIDYLFLLYCLMWHERPDTNALTTGLTRVPRSAASHLQAGGPLAGKNIGVN